LEPAADKDTVLVPVSDDGTTATKVIHKFRRYVVVDSPHRHVRDTGDGPSSSPRPRTDPSILQTGCVRAASSTTPRSSPPQTRLRRLNWLYATNWGEWARTVVAG
jgi:hypothetical protein